MSEDNIKQTSSLIDDLNPELERNYLSVKEQATWKMDWNMLLYSEEDESGFKLDWNKLIYNEEQLEEFNLQRQEKIVQPDKYEYLFENPTHRTPMELFYLKQAGYAVEELECEEDNVTIVKKLIVTGLLREV
jgi:hypothetical protein